MRRLILWLLAGSFIWAEDTLAESAADEAVIYSFRKNGSDGQLPEAQLLERDGKLYGTTFYGGADLYGTVFSVDPTSGVGKVLHTFTGERDGDGAAPLAGLINFGGKLYGTTWGGGKYGFGTVFAIDPNTGKENVLYSFTGSPDGAGPSAALVDVNGVLYGTTSGGGRFLEGTVFAIDPASGRETVPYSFSGDCFQGGGGDACEPSAPLIDVGGTLYGTTAEGGLNDFGAVFSFDPITGTEFVLYSFGNGTDGGYPYAGLLEVDGKLYGTCYEGGTSRNGVIFSMDPSTGGETVIHSFTGSSDGRQPKGTLIPVHNNLYGTTVAGGSSDHGTVFVVNRVTSVETVLHAFGRSGSGDGWNPQTGLIHVGPELYGTTRDGGAHNAGTVFQVVR
jgi:uncharacterized repeat protein (TIGR03803 family)